MWEYMQRRARQCAEYILETGATVRACAAHFGVSKSTVHKDITERLAEIDGALCEEVRTSPSGTCAAAPPPAANIPSAARRKSARPNRAPQNRARPPPAENAPLTKEKGQRYRKNQGLTKRRFMV